MDKSKIFLDLSKCTEEEQKHIISLLPPTTNKDYEIHDDYKYLHFIRDIWFVDYRYFDKTELTYPEFIKLFDGGEGETYPYAELLKNADILLNMFTELDSETMTKWEQHQIDAVQFISDKINSK